LVERRRVGMVGSGDLHEVRGAVESLLSALNKEKHLEITPANLRGYDRTAGGEIRWGGQVIGQFGAIDRATCEKLDLRHIPAAAEIDLDPLLGGAQHVPQLHPLPRFPAVQRDLSFILPEQSRFAELEKLVRDAHPEAMEELQYVTTYRGKPLEAGTKSVTITLVFRSATGTLTGESVEESIQKVIREAEQKLGAKLRT